MADRLDAVPVGIEDKGRVIVGMVLLASDKMTHNIEKMSAQEIASLDYGALDDEDLAAVNERIRRADIDDLRWFVRWMIREIRFLEQRLLPN